MKKYRKSAVLASVLLGLSLMQYVPVSASANPTGDLNADGVFSVADVVLLQKWLLAVPDAHLADWKAADFNQDNILNIFDLCCMKRLLIEQDAPKLNDEENQGKFYQKIALLDQQVGINAFEGILPEGWSVQMQSDWSLVNDYPAQESVVFVSPDQKAAVQILSPQRYLSNPQYGNTVSVQNFMTYLNYMNAQEYLDYCVQANYSDAEFVQDIEIDEAFQNSIQNLALMQANNMLSYIQQSDMNWQVAGYEGTVARRRYKSSQSYLEYCCAVPAYEFIMYGLGVNPSDNIQWETLNSIAYEAVDQESFQKYYEDYEMIVSNGYFTASFYSAVNYVISVIVQAKANALVSESTDLNASGTYDSSTPVSSSDMETQDRVFQAWDDYIKDEDRYTTADGNSLTTSMYNQTVAQDGDTFFVGNLTDVPSGYTVLTKQ